MKKPQKPEPEKIEIETEPDAWERFEQAVNVLSHTPPKPKRAKPPEKGKKPKKAK